MAVNYTPLDINALAPVAGIRWGTAYAGIRKKEKNDVAVALIDEGAVVAGVFTQNDCCAAPVLVSRAHLAQSPAVRALLINAGCANAATGEGGLADARQSCEALAKLAGVSAHQILPFSTGVILERLPMAKLIDGMAKAHHEANRLPALSGSSAVKAHNEKVHQHAWMEAAQAIMTTDTIPKIASRRLSINGVDYAITGIAKGAGMIHPNMATMLAFIATDACIAPALLSRMMAEIADESFNAITIDGDTSTNDSFVIVATGAAGECIDDINLPNAQLILSALKKVAQELAQAIVRDGEGATKFVTIKVEGAQDRAEAVRVANQVALSPLVKTAFFASDPNLGRILAAVGNAGVVDLDFSRVSLHIGEVLVAEGGGRAPTYNAEQEARAQAIMKHPEFSLTINLHRGGAQVVKFTCDYSYDYIKINADYRT